MAEDLGERTEQPTGKRLGDARHKGNIPRSQDLAAAIELSAGLLLVIFAGGWLASRMGILVRSALDTGPAYALADWATLRPLLLSGAMHGLLALAPFMLGVALAAYAAHTAQIGLVWTTEPLRPDLSRLNPIAGFKKLFGKRGLVKTLVGLVKMSAVLLVAGLYISKCLPRVASLPALSMTEALAAALEMAARLAIRLIIILFILGLIDFLYQRWQHRHDLRMTRQEVTEERKSMEGDPQIKGRRMRMAREIALQRINHDVPKADVIVTNPTHFSVALRYDQENMRAPKVVAKGADYLALRIRQVARQNDVKVVERPPLARALYFGVDVGREIRPEHYEAVAEVLAFVYRLEKQAAA
jgi:flagellar biosynthetic protein FlhB